jgi:HK97 family phage portal protein
MKFPWIKRAVPDVEHRSTTPTGGTGGRSIVGMMQDLDQWDMSFRLLREYSKRCAPFGSAINEIADAGCDIPPRVWDTQTEEYVDDFPALELLAYPDSGTTYMSFMRHLIAEYLTTGNPFLRSLGPVTRPPTALSIDSAQFAEITADSSGDINKIKIQNDFGTRTYSADFKDGRKRMRRSSDDETWHIFSYNPDVGSKRYFGAPIAKPLYYDVEQYVFGGKHNRNQLKRNARPSGAVVANFGEVLSKEEWEEWQRQVGEGLEGIDNSGRVLMFADAAFQQMSMTNKDMDYKSLVEHAEISIYRQFKIPLPLVSTESMTYSNYATAQVALYDRAVLPVIKFLFEQIYCAIFYRYAKDWRRYRLTFDENDISALVTRKLENAKILSSLGALRIDEIRDEIGYDALPVGGNDVWRSSGDAPIIGGTDDE